MLLFGHTKVIQEQRPQRAERSSGTWGVINTLIVPKGPIVPPFAGCVFHCIHSYSLYFSTMAVFVYAFALALPLEVLLPGNKERLKALDVKLSRRRGKESWQTSGVLRACLNLYQKWFFDNTKKMDKIGKGATVTKVVKLFCAGSFTVTRMELILRPWFGHRVNSALWGF